MGKKKQLCSEPVTLTGRVIIARIAEVPPDYVSDGYGLLASFAGTVAQADLE